MELHELVNTVASKEDLAMLVEVLSKDLADNPSNWSNIDLASYLEAIAAWIRDMDGYYQNLGRAVPENPSWQTLGEILVAARVYE